LICIKRISKKLIGDNKMNVDNPKVKMIILLIQEVFFINKINLTNKSSLKYKPFCNM